MMTKGNASDRLDFKFDFDLYAEVLAEQEFQHLGSQLTGLSEDELADIQAEQSKLLEEESRSLYNHDYSRPTQLPDDPQPLDIASLDPRKAIEAKYVLALQSGGIGKLAKVVLHDELSQYNTLQNDECKQRLEVVATRILASTHTCVLEGLLAGTLFTLYHDDAKTKSVLDAMKADGPYSPVVYVQGLARLSNGQWPTMKMWREILKLMAAYARGKDTGQIWRMDIVKFANISSRTKSDGGYRHYYKLANCRPETFTRTILAFVAQCTERLDTMKDVPEDQPLPFPMMEFGYALNVTSRFYQHYMHNSSNLLLSLAHAALLARYPNRDYDLIQHVVYQIWQPTQAVPAEIIFTRIGQGYTRGGMGFNTYPAGRSNGSVHGVSEDVWALRTERALKKTPVLENLKLSTAITKASLQSLETEVQVLKRGIELIEVEEEYQELEKELKEKKEARDRATRRCMEVVFPDSADTQKELEAMLGMKL